MKIALFSWEAIFSIHVGGVAVHVSELACALQRKGHEVHVFTRQGENQSPYENVFGVHYHRCSFGLHHNFLQEINNMCRAFVQRFFEHENAFGPFDIIHAHDWLSANAIKWIKDVRNKKSVFTMHSTEYGRCGNNFAGGQSEQIRRMEWEGMYCADKVIAVSNTLCNELKWLYSLPHDKSNVVYNGINCYQFDGWIDSLAVRKMYEIGPHDPMVLFVGRMVYQKGPDTMVQAIPKILKEYSNAKFVFSGDGEMRHEVEHTAYRLGIKDKTRFLGQTKGWRLIDLYKTADCVCVPSRNEPFGIVILESWAAGKPVVSTVNGGPAEFVWHDVNGIKIKPDVEGTRWGIETLLSDMEHAVWMGRNGRAATEDIFSWDKIAQDTLNVYQTF